jgi:hypothetical protein
MQYQVERRQIDTILGPSARNCFRDINDMKQSRIKICDIPHSGTKEEAARNSYVKPKPCSYSGP